MKSIRVVLLRAMLTLLRRCLYLVVRTKVAPEARAALNLRNGVPICYVLHQRHISNLLVLEQETTRLGLPRPLSAADCGPLKLPRAFFFLSRTTTLLAATPAPPPSTLMCRLVETALEDPRFDVQVVPVTILWGLAPGRQDSILKALFSEAWHSTSTVRQVIAILIHGRQTVVKFNAPFSLRESIDGEQNTERARRKLARMLRVHFRREREHALGPDLSHRYNLARALLASPAVRTAIASEAEEKAIPLAKAEAQARRMALEITSDYSYAVVRALELLLDWVWHRLFDGIEIRGIDHVRGIPPGSGIIYTPCHRSHVDYLLLSFIIFREGLRPPHIAAGANLNIPVVGTILRRGGAFFLRRSLKGEKLYTAVFMAYLQGMVERGFPVEYFIEGGRSRNGRMLSPKAGILGMTMQGYAAHPSRPLLFVPVYVGYEKVMEGKTYLAELQGRTKRAESLLGVIGLVRQLRREFGKVYVSFGDPLSLPAALDAEHAGWRESADPRPSWLRGAVDHTATELARRINAAAVAGPVNLFALALLATPRDIADRAALERQLEHLMALTSSAVALSGPGEIVDRAVRLGYARVVRHPLGDLVRADPEQAGLLSYCRNNVLHLFALPALLACLLHQNRVLAEGRVLAAVRELHPLLRAELFLDIGGAQVEQAARTAIETLAARNLVRIDTVQGLWMAPTPGTEVNQELGHLGEVIRPLVERLFLVASILERQGSGAVTHGELLDQASLLAQRLALLNQESSPETAEKAQFAQLVHTLTDAGLLRAEGEGRLHFDERIAAAASQAELLLSPDLRDTIRRATRGAAGNGLRDRLTAPG